MKSLTVIIIKSLTVIIMKSLTVIIMKSLTVIIMKSLTVPIARSEALWNSDSGSKVRNLGIPLSAVRYAAFIAAMIRSIATISLQFYPDVSCVLKINLIVFQVVLLFKIIAKRLFVLIKKIMVTFLLF